MDGKIFLNFRNSSLLIIAIFCVGLLFSCDSEEVCELPREGELTTLSADITKWIENYSNANRIIFKDQNNEDVVFNVSNINRAMDEYQYAVKCSEDTSRFQTVIGDSEWLELVMSSDEINLDSIFITLLELPNPSTETFTESLTVSCGKLFSNDYSQEDGLLGFSSAMERVKLNDSLEIRNKKFFSVLEPVNLPYTPKLDIKYTEDEGIIYISDPGTSLELVYDRKE